MTDRQPVRIEVLPGVTIGEITTLGQCTQALDDFMAAIPSIEAKIAAARERGEANSPWARRATHAVRLKRMMLPRLQELRAKLMRQDKAPRHAEYMGRRATAEKLVLSALKEIAPEVAGEAWALARSREPDLFEAAGYGRAA